MRPPAAPRERAGRVFISALPGILQPSAPMPGDFLDKEAINRPSFAVLHQWPVRCLVEGGARGDGGGK